LAFKESGKQGVLMADKIKLVLAVLLVIAGLA